MVTNVILKQVKGLAETEWFNNFTYYSFETDKFKISYILP